MKSRIEEAIKAARESNEKVLASFETMLEEIEDSLKPKSRDPKWKVGDYFIPHKSTYSARNYLWVDGMDKYDNKPLQIHELNIDGDFQIKESNHVFLTDWCERWVPKRGDYYAPQVDTSWISIMREKCTAYYINLVTFHIKIDRLGYSSSTLETTLIRPATPSEIALLDSKLAEIGKRFDKDRCELVKSENKCCDNCVFGTTMRFCYPLTQGGKCDDYIAISKTNQPHPPFIIKMADMQQFVEWVSMRYFFTGGLGWLGDNDVSNPAYITTAQLYEIYKFRNRHETY